jgi:asparagine synthase (glutamine-hydrolysing)
LITSPHIAHRTELMAQIGARHGFAYAFPLLDRRVVEYAMSLPSELFVREGTRRQVFRDAMHGILPELVRQRPHKFPPFPGWLIEIADCREDLEARLTAYRSDARLAEVLDFDVLSALGAQCPSGAEARAYGNTPHPAAAATIAFVNAMALAGYLRQFEDSAEARPALQHLPAADR